MEASKKFISFEALDPEAAKHLLPGVKLQVSVRTFGQIAAQKFYALKSREMSGAVSSAPAIENDEARIVRAAAMAAPLRTGGK